MRRLYATIMVFVIALSAAPAWGQDAIYLGVELDTYFDNREYSQGSAASLDSFDSDSGTDFASRLMPYLQYSWDSCNSLVVGCELIESFGEVSPNFLTSTLPVVYYKYESEKVRAAAGIFTRDLIHYQSYSRAFFSSDYLFYNNLMSGFMGSYNSEDSFVEFVLDWEGMRSELSREKFRLLTAGRHYFGDFYYGYNASLFHFAKRDDGVHDNIVDYSILNPAVGYEYSGVVDVDVKVGGVITAQRDREVSEEWETPAMGEVAFRVDYKGLYLANELYVGANINPYFSANGYELYPNEPFFRGEGGVYNRTGIGYFNTFFEDTLSVKGELALHYDGYKLASQYIVEVGVNIFKRLYSSENRE